MKKAFSLVELLVVIAIIGVLAAVLVVSLSGGSETALAARCLSNMRNLAAACQSYALDHDRHYPPAGNVVFTTMKSKDYTELPGWISAARTAL